MNFWISYRVMMENAEKEYFIRSRNFVLVHGDTYVFSTLWVLAVSFLEMNWPAVPILRMEISPK